MPTPKAFRSRTRRLAAALTMTAGLAAATAVPTSSSATAATSVTPTLRVNTGGPAVSASGVSFRSDTGFSGGATTTLSSTADFTNTVDDVLYRTQRWGSFTYKLPLPQAGDYRVRLHFSESNWGAPGGRPGGVGSRVFSLNLEGGPVELADFDVFAAAGGAMRAVVREFTLPVKDGTLNITTSAKADQAMVNAIEVFRVTTAVQTTAPSAPTGVTGTADLASSTGTLTWLAPATDGGSPITGYRVSRDGTDARGSGPWATTVAATERSYTFWNLVSGTPYELTVQAVNAAGTGVGASTTVTVPAPAATRDFTLQPFSRTSVWNLPIARSATFESATSPRTANLIGTGGIWANEGVYSHPISQGEDNDPLATVTDVNDSRRSGTFRVPSTATIAAGTDKHMHVISSDRRYIHETWATTRQSPTSYTVGRHHKVDLQGTGMGPQNGTRAYGGSAIGGLIRAWEVDPTHPAYTGEIKHPIAMALRDDQLLYTGGNPGYSNGYGTAKGYVWPATEQDWNSPWAYNGQVPMGAYIAIPPSVDLTTLGLTPQGLMLARAYQNYGGYVTDRSGDMILAYVEPSRAGSTFTSALLGPSWTASDLKKIRAQLRIVTNNTAQTPNGGTLDAPRMAPLLP